MSTAPSQPYFTRRDDGTVEATWPDPLADSYPVSSAVMRQWVETHNDLVTSQRLLNLLVDESPCRFDHHGHCQEHGQILDAGEMCPHEAAKRFLAGFTPGAVAAVTYPTEDT